MNRSPLRLAMCLSAVLLFAGCATPTDPGSARTAGTGAVDEPETKRAHALFEAYWDESARLNPEWATYRGDHRFGDRLRDASPEGIAAQDAYWRALRQRAASLDRSRLSLQDRLSADLLEREADNAVLLQRFDGYRTMTVNGSTFPFQAQFAGLMRAAPVARAAQVEQLLARMAAYPRRVEQEIVQLAIGMRGGWVPPRPGVERALAQIDRLLADPVEKSPFYEPFTRLGDSIPAAEREALRSRGARAVAEQVLPAMRRLREFVVAQYLPAAPPDGSLLRYPGGDQVYEALVRIHTTTDLTPRQIHDIGLAQMARLRAGMEAVMRGTGFAGDFAAWLRMLNEDPRFFYGSSEELLAGYRDIAKRIDPELPRLFAELPRATYGIRAIPAFMGPGAAANYSGPSIDGTTPGWFNANVAGARKGPTWAMESLVAHETVPGHHLQVARAIELQDLPAFRRRLWITAYGEGWGLYAETLGERLGLYRDPYSRFGYLRAQAFRAARLVVDTGIHALGWSRQQAIDYLRDEAGLGPDQASGEVDRYTAGPGQALAYMIGQLRITALRDRAMEALGPRFDIRRFHMVVLDSGPVPLDILEHRVDAWIASTQAEPAPAKGPM